MHEKVGEQLSRISRGPSDDELEPLQAAGLLRAECIAAARILKDVESKLLAHALEALDNEVSFVLHLAHLSRMSVDCLSMAFCGTPPFEGSQSTLARIGRHGRLRETKKQDSAAAQRG
uniref:Uncharacterized protein n=1 Tax=Photinus pyralis TaxID=7054 RepID=A0A1Y1NA75_PHOPY